MNKRTSSGRRGFTLIELTIVLVVAGLLFVGLWRLLAGGNQQVRDQGSANQQTQLISAVKAYLASAVVPGAGSPGSGQDFLSKIAANKYATLTLPPAGNPAGSAGCTGAIPADAGLCYYLPAGFSAATPNSYGQTYTIQVLKDGTALNSPPTTYSFMIITVAGAGGGEAIPDASGGRIASLIGNDGGFIYSTNICGAVPAFACGAYGTWSQNTGLYGYGGTGPATASGEIATRTSVSPSTDNTFPWLERNISIPGDTTYRGWNTMTTDLFMGGISTQGGNTFGNIYLGPITNPAGNPAIPTPPPTIVPGSINLASPGAVTGGGAINMQGGTINMQSGQILGDGLSYINLTPSGSLTAPATTPSAIQITVTAATTATPLLISAVNNAGLTLINATNGCDIESSAGGGAVVPGTLTYKPAGCNYAISTDNINVVHLVNATSLYATQFIYNGSDIRLKSNIHPLASSLDNVMKLKPVSFTYKAGGPPTFGVIAQDIEKVYPQLVGENKDGMKMVNYNGLIAPLIGAVQELKQENDDLRHQLKEQGKRQDELERKIKSKTAD